MRAPVEWLRQYAPIPASVKTGEIVDAFTRLGLEVEDVHLVPPTSGTLVVGEVKTIEELTEFKKPIRFTTVALGAGNGPDGSDEPRGIVCGARNFVVGDKVIVALPGTVLPGGFEIAARKTYGKVSDGMICSARELGIGEDHDGIVTLDRDAEVGRDARDLLGTDADDGAVIEFSVTPDRGYALSIRGLARELAAAYGVEFTDPAAVSLREAGAGRGVRIVDEQRCARFVAVSAGGVDPAAPSPWFIRRRLTAAGIRSISLAVDVTNYVMVELGHPLHAFDADKLTGGIVVRRAAAGEELRTLDGVDRTLTDDDVVVADEAAALSLAGVMGGEASEISAGTTNVVIEAASWDPSSISRTVRRHRLPSEAARRYERAVDPAISAVAAETAGALLVRYGGGSLGGRTDAGAPPAAARIAFPVEEASRLAGRFYDRASIVRRLTEVGCAVAETDDDEVLSVTPPAWRPDLTRPADLVEEIARLEGYDTIIPVLPVAPVGKGLTPAQRRRRKVADALAGAGLTQVLSFPFMGAAELDALRVPADDVRRRAVTVANPLDTDRPLMATTLLPGLLATTLRNLSRGAKNVALYEVGQVVHPAAGGRAPALPVDRRPSDDELAALEAVVPDQPVHVAVVLTGQWERDGWWGRGRAADATDAFAIARRLAEACGVAVTLRAADAAPWHPGRCAAVVTDGGTVIGHAGELHPAVIENLGLPPRAVALEVNLDLIGEPAPPVPPVVSPFPPVHLDMALVVDAGVDAGAVTEALRAGGGELLESIRLFDVYTGDQIAAGKKSLAFALVVRAADRTLTAAEALAVRDSALAAAAQRVGAEIRA